MLRGSTAGVRIRLLGAERRLPNGRPCPFGQAAARADRRVFLDATIDGGHLLQCRDIRPGRRFRTV